VQLRHVAAGWEGVAAYGLVGGRVAWGGHRHLELERLAVPVHLVYADEGRPRRPDPAVTEPGEELRERVVHGGRHSIRDMAPDCEVGQRGTLLDPRLALVGGLGSIAHVECD
jgi:hypothetical protein